MARATAFAVLLCECDYDWPRAERLADILDKLAPEGMSADDLFSALLRWRDKPRPPEEVYAKLQERDNRFSWKESEAWKFVAYWARDDVTTQTLMKEAMQELATMI